MAAKSLNFIESVHYLQRLLPENNRKKTTGTNQPPSAQVRTQTAIEAITKNIGSASINKPNKNPDSGLAGINQQKNTIEEMSVRINQLSKQLDQLKSFVSHQLAAKSKNR